MFRMQGNIDGEENARLGGKNSRRAKKIKGKNKKKRKRKEKKQRKIIQTAIKIQFLLQNDNSAVKNQSRGQNSEVHDD